jgi:hypothetical protein
VAAQSLFIQSVFDRFVYFLLGVGYLLYYSLQFLSSWLPKFKQAILDEKYLIGHQLHNLEDSMAQR